MQQIKAETVEKAGITAEQVEQWAAWRREGKPFSHIKRDDPTHPTWPVVKAALHQHGYNQHGQPQQPPLEALVEAVEEHLINVEPETPAELDDELRAMGFDPKVLEERAHVAAESERAGLRAVVVAGGNGAALRSVGKATLAALQQLVSTLSASDVRLSGPHPRGAGGGDSAVKKPTHTPGPWKVNVDDYGYKTIKGGKSGPHQQAQYKRIANTEGVFPEEEDAANARLIAAAPELLAACQAFLASFDGPGPDRTNLIEAMKLAEAAIRKAAEEA